MAKCGLFGNNDSDSDSEDEETRPEVVRIKDYFERVIPSYNDKLFQSHFRISRATFEIVLPLIINKIEKNSVMGRPSINFEKQVLAVLWILATPDSYRSIGERFDMSKSSLSRCFFRVTRALNELAALFIKWPQEQEKERVKQDFENIANIPNILGAVDGTFIVIKAPKEDSETYITRKCNYAMTLQAICTSRLYFIDCFVGYPGSVSDTRIFRNSDIYQKVMLNMNNYFPNDEFIIGDKAYPVLPWCMSPYINRGALTPAQQNFNSKITSTRQVIERSFSLLFGRFRRLKYLDMNTTAFIPATVLAACVLHNMCLTNDSPDTIKEMIREGRPHVHANGNNEFEHGVPFNLYGGNEKRNQLSQLLFHAQR
ncbi:unnamed protein product [Tenebrio molitor]|jgi:hypothetical protein|nr:unnamed protein product [Tenebrio molitor]